MAVEFPNEEEIERRIQGLFAECELGTFATVSEEGRPHSSCMHITADKLLIYTHTYTYTRKYAHLKANPYVSYEVHPHLEGGFEDRMKLRSIQVSGKASIVEDPSELERVLELNYEKHTWLREFDLYASFKREMVERRQCFLRVDPFEALYTDNTVHFQWRQMLKFDDKARITSVDTYPGDVPGA